MASSSSIAIMGYGIGTRGTISAGGMSGGVIKGPGTCIPRATSIASGTDSGFISSPGIATCTASRFASLLGTRIRSAAITVTTTTGSGGGLSG